MQPLLALKGIDKSFPGVKALSGAALNVYPGRVMALVGENGAGKSTMMKVLTGIYQKDAGTQNFLGKEVTFNGPKSSQEAGIGIIHQELNLIPQLTIAENIFLGREFVNRLGCIDWKKCMPKRTNCWLASISATAAIGWWAIYPLAISKWSKLLRC